MRLLLPCWNRFHSHRETFHFVTRQDNYHKSNCLVLYKIVIMLTIQLGYYYNSYHVDFEPVIAGV
jgi:hypothetical protein